MKYIGSFLAAECGRPLLLAAASLAGNDGRKGTRLGEFLEPRGLCFAKGWLVVAYISIFPSFLSQIFFMRGVELIGPGRAGVFINLVPIFSSFLAVVLLGDPFHFYHAAALVLVLGAQETYPELPCITKNLNMS